MPTGKLIMMNKRKRDDTSDAAGDSDNDDWRAKRQRIRKRSHSDPLRNERVPAEKRQALRRLFGRISAVNLEGAQQSVSEPDESEYEDLLTEQDEEALVDEVPADMDPEQLGFLVCAQETLRFLNGLGISYQHPVFNHLRQRLLQGISEIGVA